MNLSARCVNSAARLSIGIAIGLGESFKRVSAKGIIPITIPLNYRRPVRAPPPRPTLETLRVKLYDYEGAMNNNKLTERALLGLFSTSSYIYIYQGPRLASRIARLMSAFEPTSLPCFCCFSSP